MAEPFIFDANGNLGIWTGTGYDFSAPMSFSKDSIVQNYRVGNDLYDSWDQAYANRYQTSGEGSFIGDPVAEYALQLSTTDPTKNWTRLDNNRLFQYDPATGAVNLQLKSADKEGTTLSYVLDPATGQYKLDQNAIRKNYWDTNTAEQQWMMAMPLAVGAGAYLAAGALGATGATGAGGAGAAGGAAPVGGAWGIVDPAFTAWNAIPAAEVAASAGIGALDPYALTAAELGAPVETYLGTAPIAGEASGAAAGISEGLGSLYGTVGSTPYIPEVGPYAPGEAPGTISAPSPSIGDYASRVGDWVLRNPRLVLSGIGAVGSLLEDNNSGSGGAGGGSGSTGWAGPIPSMSAVQARFDPPPGYRPGFSPEHVYIETAYGPGAASVPIQMSTTPSGATPLPPPNIPPLPPQTFAAGGAVSPWTMPTGIQSLRIPTRRPLGTGAQYQSPAPVGGLPALFDYLNTQPTAPPLLTTRDLSPATQYASWSQTGFNPTLTNNQRASTRAGPRVYAGGTRGGFGGYGIGQFAEGGYVQGPGTETSDSIPAIIEGDADQPAALSKNEFVLPAWLVEEIGDGSSQTGAQRLYAFMERMKAQRGNQLAVNPDALSALA
jgi:hypothetical protein